MLKDVNKFWTTSQFRGNFTLSGTREYLTSQTKRFLSPQIHRILTNPPQKISQLVNGAKGLSGDLTAAFQLDSFFYLLKGSKYWKAERGPTGSLTIANDKEYPKDVFVDFFGCSPKAMGVCAFGVRCNSAATSTLASAATTDQSWKKVFWAQKHVNF